MTLRQIQASPSLRAPLTQAFAHLPHGVAGPPDLTIYAIDLAASAFDLGPPVWNTADIGSMGLIKGLETGALRAQWDFAAASFQILDLDRNLAVICLSDTCKLRSWELTFPLRTILHWHALANNGVLLHAGAVGTAKLGGALLLGAGGAGKSTATLACLQAGLQVAGDDFVHLALGAAPQVHSLYCTAKLNADSTAWFPELQGRMTFEIGPNSEKNVFFSDALGVEHFVPEFPLRCLMRLERTGQGETTFAPISAGAVFQACAANTTALLPGDRARTISQLAVLCRSVPGYVLRVGTNIGQIGHSVRRALEQLET